METEIAEKFKIFEQKLDAIYVSVEKTRNYFKWTMIISLVVFVIPLLALIVVVPMALSSYIAALGL